MGLIITVKISSVSSLSDARYCAGMGVDMLGYALHEETPNRVDPESFREINDWVSGISVVGEFENDDTDLIRKKMQLYDVDMIETARPELMQELHGEGKPIILKLNMDGSGHADLQSTMTYGADLADIFLLETSQSADDDEVTRSIRALSGEYPLLLSAKLHGLRPVALVESLGIKGFALKAGVELRPGYKDYDELADILEALEDD